MIFLAVAKEIPNGREAILRALLESVLARFDSCIDDRAAKALAVEAREIMVELEEIAPVEVVKPVTPIDELRKRREKRSKTG